MTMRKILEQKSRALKPDGELPQSIPSFVVARPDPNKPSADHDQQTQQKRIHIFSLTDAMRLIRRGLLLGDLGTGKSTTAATFVIKFQEEAADGVALFIPARFIPRSGDASQVPWLSVADFVSALSKFVQDEVFAGSSVIDLKELLDSNVDLAMVVDGLDEVPLLVAREIAERLGQVVDAWPRVRALATGRPVELQGLDYTRWQVFGPHPLDDDAKHQIFVEEALADEAQLADAATSASAALDRLRSNPELHFSADTPLFCRLLFSHLRRSVTLEIETLGDLLFLLLKQRLVVWAVEDRKISTTPVFDSEYPDPTSRFELLARLVSNFGKKQAVLEEEARTKIRILVSRGTTASNGKLADEALRYFHLMGLVVLEGGRFEMSLKAFEDLCRGYAYAEAALSKSDALQAVEQVDWRSIAFAATVSRRLGWFEQSRPAFLNCIDDILTL